MYNLFATLKWIGCASITHTLEYTHARSPDLIFSHDHCCEHLRVRVMSSFNTPGWDLSSNSIAIEPANKTAAKKRKHAEGAAGGEDSAPAVNVEALLSKFRSLDSKNKKKSAQQHKGPDSGPNNKKAKLSGNKSDRPQGKPPAPPAESKGQLVGNKQSKKKKNNNNKKDAGKPQSQPEETSATAEPSTSSQSQAAPASEPVSQPEAVTESQSKKRQRKDKKNKQQQQHGSEGGAESQAMSTLQNTMKTKLGGARFRWINEQLVGIRFFQNSVPSFY